MDTHVKADKNEDCTVEYCTMPRPIWKGHISFGLVNVPVTLYSAEQRTDLNFRLIDSRNSARVRYERVNEATGEEVPWDKIVKGYEYDGGNYVLVSNEELESASAELTKTIEIVQFVDVDAIDPMYFEKPYILVPGKGSEKGYALLREAMLKAKRVGIAQVVIRARGHLAALVPRGNALILELLRFQEELRPIEEFDIPEKKEGSVSKKELELAEQLIEGMTREWEPDQYKDEYREAVMKLIERRIESGEIEHVVHEEAPQAETPKTVNFMEVLKESLKKKPKSAPTAKSAARKTTRKRAARKTKAG